MNIAKIFWTNLKDKSTTGAAACTIAAWGLNTYCKFIPQDVANAILVFANALILAVFAKSGNEAK